MHNVYYDTPDQILRRRKIALRLRRVGSAAKATWLQTLKTGGNGNSALSPRGEWESAVPHTELDLLVLQVTPWPKIDADGTVFSALVPCFVTDFERTRWTVRKRDESIVELSLDIGQIRTGYRCATICELEHWPAKKLTALRCNYRPPHHERPADWFQAKASSPRLFRMAVRATPSSAPSTTPC